MKTVDVTPKWSELIEVIMAILENPDAKEEIKGDLRKELRRMAKAADLHNAKSMPIDTYIYD